MDFIQDILSVPKKGYVTNTKLRGGTEINDKKLNYQIAEAITTLPSVSSFGKGRAVVPVLITTETLEGALTYKREDVKIAINFNPNTKTFDQVFVNQTEENFEPSYIIQALLLTELSEKTILNFDNSALSLKDQIINSFDLDLGDKDNADSDTFATLVQTIENHFNDGRLIPFEINFKDDDDDDLFDDDDDEGDDITFINVTDLTAKVGLDIIKQPRRIDVEDENKKELSVTNSSENATVQSEGTSATTVLVKEQLSLFEETNAIETEPPKRKRGRPRKNSVSQKNEEKSISASSELNQDKTTNNNSVHPVVRPTKSEFTNEELIAKGYIIWDDDAIRNYLKQFKFELPEAFDTQEEFIEAIIEFRKEQREKNVPQHQYVFIKPCLVYTGDAGPLEYGLKNMMTDVHVIYKGPAGAGKTVLAETVSSILNMPLYTMNGSVDTDADSIIGSKEASNGSTYSVDGLILKAMRYAGIFYADEVNFTLPEILSVVNASLDHRKEIYNPNTHETVFGHENFRFIGAMNEGYQGTRDLNEATGDRSVGYIVDYMSPHHLREYLRGFTKRAKLTNFQRKVLKMDKISDADLVLLVDIATHLQEGVKSGELPQEAGSIRNIEQLARMSRVMSFDTAVRGIISKFKPEVRPSVASALQSVNRLNINVDDFLTA